MRPKPLVVPFLLVLACLAVVADPAGAINNKYVESFATKQYCDRVNTTALWDTAAGELRLPPFQITLAGSCDTPGLAYGVAISGDYACVADQSSGLRVINITNPASPTLAGSYDTPAGAYGVAISGDYAYVADAASGLQVISITNPASPTLAGSYDTPGSAVGVAISGDYAYVADFDCGLQVINITNPASPTLAGSYDTPGSARGVAISGDYAYVADGLFGLQVIDITNPASPTLAGSYATPGYARGVAISGDYAYVADYGSGLQVLNITNPASPTLAGSYATPGTARGVAISGDYAYVADGSSGLQVISITNPATPMLAGSYDTPDLANGVAISGDYAYVADGSSGLQVLEVFQRRYDTESNVGRSLAVDDSDNTIIMARLSSTQTDSIRWEISADSGANWMGIPPNNAWQVVSVTGTNLIWRSTHYYTGGGINPICTDLSIGWLYGFPVIDRIADIANDQGRQVRIVWTRNAYDFPGSSTPITEYAIFRRVDQVLASSSLSGGKREVNVQRLVEDGQGLLTYPPGDWDFVKTVPADCEDSYSTVVATLADSTGSEGTIYTAFFVRARTATPGAYYDSPVDSGYSVDNLAPAPPANLRMASPTALAWDESKDKDFKYFTVYGSAAPGLDSTATLIGYTIGTAMDVIGDVYEYYHVTASDFSGNEGDASSVENTYSGVRHPDAIPAVFALKPNQPNPFAVRTSIGFDLPVSGAVSLKVFDAQGRRVKTLADHTYPAGCHSVAWAGDDEFGRPVGAGIYFVRIEAGDFRATGKILLTR